MEPGSQSSLGISVLLGLVMINAVLSLANSALVNVSKSKLRELADAGKREAAFAVVIAEDATRLLAAHQLASVLIRFFAAAFVTLTLANEEINWLVKQGLQREIAAPLSYGITLLLSALVMVLFGEMIPSAFAASRPEMIAIWAARPMSILMTFLSPLSRLMLWVSGRVMALFGGHGDTPYVTEEEIKTLVDAGSEEGVLEDEEKAMIYSIFQFGDMIAREVMIPRIDIIALDSSASIQRALETVLKHGHSRIPIYEDTIDSIIGLLYAKDLLRLFLDQKSTPNRNVRELIRPAYFIPETKKAGVLLEDLQQRKIHMAIVVDEYGGTAGLVTIEDLVEEIVGDIQDEYDPDEEAEYTRITDDEYLFDAGINLIEVNNVMDVDLPNDESDTLGGYIFSMLGKVPLMGETYSTERLVIKVEQITGRRIRKVRVTKLPPPELNEKGEKVDKSDKSEKDEKVSDPTLEPPLGK
jgi:CBS domain containing-hemolysin-like protein